MAAVEPILHIQQRVEDLVRTTDTSFQRVHSTLTELRKHADGHADAIIQRMRAADEASYQDRKDKILAQRHNRPIGHVCFVVLPAVTFVVFLVLGQYVNPGTLALITRLMWFGTASVTGLVLLWGSAFNEIRHADASPWKRLRVRGKLLVLATVLSLACTAWTILMDKRAAEALSYKVDEVHQTADAVHKTTDDALKDLKTVNGQLQQLSNELTTAATKLRGDLEKLRGDLEKIRSQTKLIAGAADAIENIKKSTDTINDVKGETDAIKKSTDTISEVKKSTDTISEVKKSTDTISEVKKSTDMISEVKKSTDMISEVKKSTDTISMVKKSTDKIAVLDADIVELGKQIESVTRALKKHVEAKTTDDEKTDGKTTDGKTTDGKTTDDKKTDDPSANAKDVSLKAQGSGGVE